VPGHLKRTRVIDLTRGKKKTIIKVFYAEISKLAWDPQMYTWPKQRAARDYRASARRGIGQGQGQPPAKPVLIMNYTTKMGRDLLKQQHTIPNPVVRKWKGILSNTFRLRWNTVWAKGRVNKESGLLWLIWHRAPVVNEWRRRIRGDLDTSCVVCCRGTHETVLHRF
jgi:hypothetical protein